MDVNQALQTATETPLTVLLAIALMLTLSVFGAVGWWVARAISGIVPLIANLVGTLHELSEKIGDQLDALKAIDDGTKQRTEKGVALVLEHNERGFASLRKQLDDNHAAQLAAIERLHLDVQLQLGTQRTLKFREQDKET